MARHRAVRSMNIDDELDEDDDHYGHSFEDNYCISPATAAQFTFNRDEHTMASYMVEPDIPEEDNEEDDDDEKLQELSTGKIRKQLNDIDTARLNSCLEEIHNVLGETTSEQTITEAIIKNNFDVQASLNELLTQQGQDVPKPQRAPRSRRNRSQASNTEGQQLVTPLKDPSRTVESIQGFVGDVSNSVAKLTITPKKQPVRGFVTTPNTSPVKAVKSVDNGLKGQNAGITVADVTSDVALPSSDSAVNLRSETDKSPDTSATSISVVESNSAVESSLYPAKDPNFRPPLPKSSSKTKPRINVKEEYAKRQDEKELINLVVIGHVDAGKSTLMGHLLYQLGSVNKKAMHKYEQESRKCGKGSFAYAWVLDETEEERTRGVTMDIAQTRFETTHKIVTLLDAPGHKDFIPNMITGTAQADVGILVINATKGEFETGFEAGGQTREHTVLARSLGVSQLIVAVNKMDTVDWSSARYDHIVHKIGQFLKQAGFKETDISFVPCSGLGGENLTKPVKDPFLSSWYDGPTLVEQIDKFTSLDRPIDKAFRLNIGDVFKGVGSGFSISGRVGAGHIQNGDRVIVMPAGVSASIKGVYIDDAPSGLAFAGDHVIITLSGLEINNVNIGSVLCHPLSPCKCSTRIRAKIVIFNLEVPLTKGFPMVFHYQSINEPAVIKRLVAQLNKTTGEIVKNKPRCLLKNTSAVVEIEFERMVCVELYRDYKDLGRFMLRSGGATIAAGMVEEILQSKTQDEQ
ncbi:HBS1-like protein isoform X2 [Gigantopelta aegis]|uniref:HBS1-like protein isoform X2 n=1 Tax=Gigantopelta aegis TaxID=1735272 RepID=UPI001B889719|nr:HBS1-like protein isoform X2 [Gigantopelta aegis]